MVHKVTMVPIIPKTNVIKTQWKNAHSRKERSNLTQWVPKVAYPKQASLKFGEKNALSPQSSQILKQFLV